MGNLSVLLGNLSVLLDSGFPSLQTLVLRSCDLDSGDMRCLTDAREQNNLEQTETPRCFRKSDKRSGKMARKGSLERR